MTSPKRGEVWLVRLDPTIGAEIKKTRPVVIVSSDLIGKLPLKWVVPITDWKSYFSTNLWHIYLEPSTTNGLTKTSAADVFQLRRFGYQTFHPPLRPADQSRSTRNRLRDRRHH